MDKRRRSGAIRLGVFLLVVVSVSPHMGAAQETAVTADEIKLGIVGRAHSFSSGRVAFTASFAFHPDTRLEDPETFAEEVDRRFERHIDSIRRAGLDISPAREEEVRQEIRMNVKSELKKSEFRKDCMFTWSGNRFRADVDEYIRPELYTVPHSEIAHSSLTWNGETGSYYTDNVIDPGSRGFIDSRPPDQRNELSRQNPTLWVLRWSEEEEFSDADLILESSEERFGKTSYWVSRPDRNEKALVCPELGYMALEYRKFYESDENQVNIVAKVERIMEYKGYFFPGECTRTSYRKDGSLWGDHRFVVEELVLNEPVAESEFEPAFPSGTMVTDRRLDPPLSYAIGITEEAAEEIVKSMGDVPDVWQPVPGTKTREAVAAEYEDTMDAEAPHSPASDERTGIRPAHLLLCVAALGLVAFGGFWFARRAKRSDES